MPDRCVRAWIPLRTKLEVCADPCRVCGVPYGLKCDHILPVARGGGSDRANLQSLCHDCNHIKGSRLNNEEVAAVVSVRGLRHFQLAVWRHDTRYENNFDRRDLRRWIAESPERAKHAEAFYLTFLQGRA